MVCGLACSTPRPAAVAPSSCVWVRLRLPSTEPMLEVEWVRERTRRVILAVGTTDTRERERARRKERGERENRTFRLRSHV